MPETPIQDEPVDEILDVPLEDIDPFVHQSRETFDEAEQDALTEDIKLRGQLQPGVAVYDASRKRFGLIVGERRMRALKRAGRLTMAVKVIRGHLTPGQMLEMNLAENLQRESLNPIERGKAFRRLMQLGDLNASQVAARMSVSNATVSRDLSLLDLPESLKARVASGQLPATVAGSIARLDDDDARLFLADQFEDGKLTRPGVIKEVNRRLTKPNDKKSDKPPRLAVKLSGVSVSISGKPEKLSFDSLINALTKIAKEAKSLKDGGETSLAALAAVLKAS